MKRQRWPLGALICGLFALAGCNSTQEDTHAPVTGAAAPVADPDPDPADTAAAARCPMGVPGARVAATDVEGGAALDFTTPSGDVAELYRRVREMAEMHGRHHHGAGMGRGPQGGGMMGGGGMMMSSASASVEEIDGGARLVLRPADPGELAALRERVRAHAARMAGGACPWASGQAGGDARP